MQLDFYGAGTFLKVFVAGIGMAPDSCYQWIIPDVAGHPAVAVTSDFGHQMDTGKFILFRVPVPYGTGANRTIPATLSKESSPSNPNI